MKNYFTILLAVSALSFCEAKQVPQETGFMYVQLEVAPIYIALADTVREPIAKLRKGDRVLLVAKGTRWAKVKLGNTAFHILSESLGGYTAGNSTLMPVKTTTPEMNLSIFDKRPKKPRN